MNVYWGLIGLVVTIGANLAIYFWMDITLSSKTKHSRLLFSETLSYYLKNNKLWDWGQEVTKCTLYQSS
jgi:hypothetical protein